MQKETNTNPVATSKTPSHAAYHIRKTKGDKSLWAHIGSAWAHADGKGFNIQIDTVPLDGRISLRVLTDKAE